MKDKKIGKFRKWLIEKLGGELPIPIKPVIIEKHIPTKTFESSICFTEDQVHWYSHMYDKPEGKIRSMLWEKLGEEAKELMVVDCNKDEENLIVKVRARLTIVNEVQNESKKL